MGGRAGRAHRRLTSIASIVGQWCGQDSPQSAETIRSCPAPATAGELERTRNETVSCLNPSAAPVSLSDFRQDGPNV